MFNPTSTKFRAIKVSKPAKDGKAACEYAEVIPHGQKMMLGSVPYLFELLDQMPVVRHVMPIDKHPCLPKEQKRMSLIAIETSPSSTHPFPSCADCLSFQTMNRPASVPAAPLPRPVAQDTQIEFVFVLLLWLFLLLLLLLVLLFLFLLFCGGISLMCFPNFLFCCANATLTFMTVGLVEGVTDPMTMHCRFRLIHRTAHARFQGLVLVSFMHRLLRCFLDRPQRLCHNHRPVRLWLPLLWPRSRQRPPVGNSTIRWLTMTLTMRRM